MFIYIEMYCVILKFNPQYYVEEVIFQKMIFYIFIQIFHHGFNIIEKPGYRHHSK